MPGAVRQVAGGAAMWTPIENLVVFRYKHVTGHLQVITSDLDSHPSSTVSPAPGEAPLPELVLHLDLSANHFLTYLPCFYIP
uniref:Uncharacterized protein n=1 Tax=Timema douglasi TaxID=61478 RepID=A0A7R8Z311_TIMDO|nr:unnamed protein product [Timema douglasi]